MPSKQPRYKEPTPCPNCGGRHYGSPAGYCPYKKAPCVICNADTIYACSDCQIDTGKSVHICEKVSCQREHEELHPDRKLQDLMPDRRGKP